MEDLIMTDFEIIERLLSNNNFRNRVSITDTEIIVVFTVQDIDEEIMKFIYELGRKYTINNGFTLRLSR